MFSGGPRKSKKRELKKILPPRAYASSGPWDYFFIVFKLCKESRTLSPDHHRSSTLAVPDIRSDRGDRHSVYESDALPD